MPRKVFGRCFLPFSNAELAYLIPLLLVFIIFLFEVSAFRKYRILVGIIIFLGLWMFYLTIYGRLYEKIETGLSEAENKNLIREIAEKQEEADAGLDFSLTIFSSFKRKESIILIPENKVIWINSLF